MVQSPAGGGYMFGRQKKQAAPAFDKAGKIPVIRSSICTGEQVAGFKDTASGKFTEIMLVRTDADFKAFLHQYGIDEADVKREW